MKMNNLVKDYLTSIGSIPVMDHNTSISCFKMLENDETSEKEKKKIYNHIVESNLKLVVSVAKQYKTSNELPFEDILQEGNIGLMKAIDRYKWAKGYRFSTYATWWIRQSISIHISKHRRTVRLPSHAIGVQRRVMTAIAEFNDKTGMIPTIDELKEILSDVSETVLEATFHAGMGTVSIHTTSATNDSNSDAENAGRGLENKLHDKKSSPFDQLAHSEMFETIASVLNELDTREAAVIRMRFGLYDTGINRDEFLEEE